MTWPGVTVAAGVLLGALLALGGGCGDEAPRIDEVVPPVVDEGAGAEIRVRGAGFHWRYDSLTNNATGSFKVRVGDLPLDDVTWVDASELRARVPATVRAGRHDVSVDGPTGSHTRPEALLVRTPDDADAGVADGG